MRTFILAAIAAIAMGLDHEGLVNGSAQAGRAGRPRGPMGPMRTPPRQPPMMMQQDSRRPMMAPRRPAPMQMGPPPRRPPTDSAGFPGMPVDPQDPDVGTVIPPRTPDPFFNAGPGPMNDTRPEGLVFDTFDSSMSGADFFLGLNEVDLEGLTAGDNSPPTTNQLLNVLASRLEGFVNPEGILDTTGLFSELPQKRVGRRSMTGAEFGCNWPQNMQYWDGAYEAQSARCKQEMLWEKCLEDDRTQPWFDGVEQLPIFTQDILDTFDWVGDEMPEGRMKVVHAQGTVTKIRYESVGDHPYTGIFTGAEHGIMRISEVSRTTPDVVRTSPGFGIKFLRDGMSSANGFGMFSFSGQPSFNFLTNSWTTHLAEPQNTCGRMTISSKFAEGTRHLGNTSVMEFSEFDQFGRRIEIPVWPFMMRFEPTITQGFPDTFQADFTEQMSLIMPDIHLFDVYALDEPIGLGGEEKLVGRLHTTSITTPSLWGDEHLFFRHMRFNFDLARRPEWFDHVEIFEDPLWTDVIPLPQTPPVQGSCPFSWLFGLNVF